MMRHISLTLALLFCLLLLISDSSAQRKNSKNRSQEKKAGNSPAKRVSEGPLIVSRVVGGDLLELSSGERVRLLGADAPVLPESKKPGQEPWASEAKRFTEKLTLGKEVTLKSPAYSTDEYGRRIGFVYAGDTWVDYELIREGHAVLSANRSVDNRSRQLLIEAQKEARTGSRGIWDSSNPLPQPPREFRAANNLSEGDDSKADSWKRTAINPPVTEQPGKPTGKPNSSANSPNVSNPSTNPGTVPASGRPELLPARLALDALIQIDKRISEGVKSGELSRLVATAGQRFDEMMSGPVDRVLARDIKDALDAYRLALDAFKRKESATTGEAERFTRFIDGALEIAGKSTTSALKRLEYIQKQK
jgi:endonuclease YncB( thermonuclease family)